MKETVVASSNLFQGIGMKVSIKKKKKIIKKTHKESWQLKNRKERKKNNQNPDFLVIYLPSQVRSNKI